ncbi:hypothetical protein IQ22_04216 [Pseudomonas duriflava]|uniref:Uncharacterized protein n=1 Tax=Pseudomonas duriflava TaxID=459528 RepID=A0A562PUI5_9PSED|nr:hypothetical protein [Pseudomonas duriflava]TWI48023.1 hypothetical protein IQ22_04216 [Pseudomonas duriflava]
MNNEENLPEKNNVSTENESAQAPKPDHEPSIEETIGVGDSPLG